MGTVRFFWTPEIEEHPAEHGVTIFDYEAAYAKRHFRTVSRRSGLPAFFGETDDGRILFGVYRAIDDLEAEPVTAYFVSDSDDR